MAVLDALLGGLQGGLKSASGTLDQQVKLNQAKDLLGNTRQREDETSRRDFQQDIIKGVILQSLKPKSRPLNLDFSSELTQGTEGLLDPETINLLKILGLDKVAAIGGPSNSNIFNNQDTGTKKTKPGARVF